MGSTLRKRILITLLPLLILVAVMGSTGIWLLHRLGGSIDVILRENYDSVIAMQDLKEAADRIDSSCQFIVIAAGLKDSKERQKLAAKAAQDFAANWQLYQVALHKEQNNITIHPTEDELVRRLEELTVRYHGEGEDFFRRATHTEVSHQDYHSGTHSTFMKIKQVADEILQLNQGEMKRASDEAVASARRSTLWLGTGLAAALLLAGLFSWYTARALLRPIQALTLAAQGISEGNLDAVVPYLASDELGQLAQAFNTMAHHLRDFRQSQMARLLRAQRTSQATIDSFPDPVMVVDSGGLVEMANPAARRLLGVVPMHQGQASAVPWLAPEPLRQPLALAIQGDQDYLPEGFDRTILLVVGGRERALLPRILRIRDPQGSSLGAAVLLQDVTRLRLLDQVKSNLVATASHELKTPLTGIRLVIYLLLEEKIGPLTPKQMELLLDARENSERLLAVVNNLLDLTRLEQGWRQLDVRPEAPATLLQAAADGIRPRAQDKGVDITLDVPPNLPAVAVDAARFGNALGNLLDNALTYTDRGGRITLSAGAAGDGVTLVVADTGCGIPPEHLGHVFEKFFRVPGQSRGSGTGLGLAIVQEIVTAHGGTISCASQPGVGTTFRINLPLAKDELLPSYVFGHVQN
ncbi:MAG TPA: ATP-binding protein [Gemmataceae bacterium]|jgi:NtrC-family two-component system sensor histidine kinase KinB|nr:ATP-binding protein [Gemmataceae bacterium]